MMEELLMLDDFKATLYLFSCAAMGKTIETPPQIAGKRLFEISNAHGVWSIIYAFFQKDFLANIPKDFAEITTNKIYSHMYRVLHIAKVIETLEKNGVQCCILKGATLSSLYAEPYARVSTDTDIYVKAKDVDTACELLMSLGFEIKERRPGSHHIKCISNSCGMLELHTECFDTVVADLWFDGADFFEYQFIPFQYEGVACHTLNYTEGVIFNFLHFIKHYITGLITVRQIMDNLLFLKEHRDKIDYKKLDMVLEKLNYKKFMLVCIGFGIKYLQFQPADFAYTVPEEYDESVELMLSDLYSAAMREDSGVYTEYGEKVYGDKNKKGNYKQYHLKKNNGGFFAMAKITREAMEDKYPALKNHSYLYPVFYVHRAVTGIWSKLFQKKAPADTAKNERLNLLEKLGL